MADRENLVMASASQIADRDGVTKQAVSKSIRKLLDDRPETPVDRGTQGQVVRISLAHYDHYRKSFVNPAKASAPLRDLDDDAGEGRRSSAAAPIRIEDSFDEARRQSEWLKVGREKIRIQEDAEQLIRKDKNEQALTVIGGEVQSILRRLSNRADEIAMAVSKEGVHGVRVLLRQIAFDMGTEIADKLVALAAAAPERDALIEDEEA